MYKLRLLSAYSH